MLRPPVARAAAADPSGRPARIPSDGLARGSRLQRWGGWSRNCVGQADANTKIAASLNDSVLQYLLIQKLGDKIQVIFLPTGQSFILDPRQLLSGNPQDGRGSHSH
jgi:hypothetical protein